MACKTVTVAWLKRRLWFFHSFASLLDHLTHNLPSAQMTRLCVDGVLGVVLLGKLVKPGDGGAE